MENNNHICHDLKTDRPDIGQPLPAILTFLPILFGLSVVGAIALNVLFVFQLGASEKAKQEWSDKGADESSQQGKIGAKIKGIKTEQMRGEDIRKWVEGSRQLQPLAVAIARSMDVDSSIAELSLFRDLANPSQVRIGLKFDNGGAKQLDSTLGAINAMGYRSYSANQTQGKGGALDYQATLIWQKNNTESINLSSNNE